MADFGFGLPGSPGTINPFSAGVNIEFASYVHPDGDTRIAVRESREDEEPGPADTWRDPVTGDPVEPVTDVMYDPITGQPIDPVSGEPIEGTEPRPPEVQKWLETLAGYFRTQQEANRARQVLTAAVGGVDDIENVAALLRFISDIEEPGLTPEALFGEEVPAFAVSRPEIADALWADIQSKPEDYWWMDLSQDRPFDVFDFVTEDGSLRFTTAPNPANPNFLDFVQGESILNPISEGAANFLNHMLGMGPGGGTQPFEFADVLSDPDFFSQFSPEFLDPILSGIRSGLTLAGSDIPIASALEHRDVVQQVADAVSSAFEYVYSLTGEEDANTILLGLVADEGGGSEYLDTLLGDPLLREVANQIILATVTNPDVWDPPGEPPPIEEPPVEEPPVEEPPVEEPPVEEPQPEEPPPDLDAGEPFEPDPDAVPVEDPFDPPPDTLERAGDIVIGTNEQGGPRTLDDLVTDILMEGGRAQSGGELLGLPEDLAEQILSGEGIPSIFSDIAGTIGNIPVGSEGDFDPGTFLRELGELLQAPFDLLGHIPGVDALTDFLGWIGETLGGLDVPLGLDWEDITGSLGDIADWFTENADIPGFDLPGLDDLLGGIGDLIGALQDFDIPGIDIPGLDDLLSALQDFDIPGIDIPGLDELLGAITNLDLNPFDDEGWLSGIGDLFQGFTGDLQDILGGLLGGAGDSAGDILGGVGDILGGVFGGIFGDNGLFNGLFDMFGNLLGGGQGQGFNIGGLLQGAASLGLIELLSNVFEDELAVTTEEVQTVLPPLSPEEQQLLDLNIQLATEQLGTLRQQQDFLTQQQELFGPLNEEAQRLQDQYNAIFTPEYLTSLRDTEQELLALELERARQGPEATEEQRALIGEMYDQALAAGESDINRFLNESVDVIARELAPARGLRQIDTPILSLFDQAIEESTRQQGQLARNLAAAESESLLNYPLAVSQLTSAQNLSTAQAAQSAAAFQETLRNQAFNNRLNLSNPALAANPNIGLFSPSGQGAFNTLAGTRIAGRDINRTTTQPPWPAALPFILGLGNLIGGVGGN